MKTCITCSLSKKLDEFPKRLGSKDGKRGECKKCYNVRLSSWSKNNNNKNQNNHYVKSRG